MKFCTKCGFEMNDEISFCPKCGTKQSVPDVNNNESNIKLSNRAESVDNHVNDTNEQQFQSNANNNYQGKQKSDSEFKMGQPKHLNFMESIGYIFNNMFKFSPTVQDNQKSIFWWNYLLVTIVSVLLTQIVQSVGYFEYLVFNTLIMFFTVASIMRRLNYLGKNKNLAWIAIVPIAVIYPVILMLFNKREDNFR
ncbi:zinc-ribbon domain-containing protein [Companilactobacillus huachuanensis]|uniref:Zinc-ribbon domain-containing protein n=1 Tax=Companilactobacillus huachuanensis TaxID=2559914 RepID=A0ABW1RLT8_9LACO|nr:zinc-ribbon domain-containing protein [Companilactobacillus huachuanensis]